MKTIPCGGCGNTDPDKRCLGCLHNFSCRLEKVPLTEETIKQIQEAELELAKEASAYG